MSNAKILVVWSNYYEQLAQQQLDSCVSLLEQYSYDYEIETVNAGCYEIPAAIKYIDNLTPYDGYIPLGLLLKGSTDHYEFIWQHLKQCFIDFAMNGIMLGNGIISAPNRNALVERVNNHERVEEAFKAIDYLIKLKQRQ